MSGRETIRFIRYRIIAKVLGWFGHTCVEIGDWPLDNLNLAIEVIKTQGGKECGSNGTPCGEIENLFFIIGGKKVRLCYEEYGEVTLWGSKSIVLPLAEKIAEEAVNLSFKQTDK